MPVRRRNGRNGCVGCSDVHVLRYSRQNRRSTSGTSGTDEMAGARAKEQGPSFMSERRAGGRCWWALFALPSLHPARHPPFKDAVTSRIKYRVAADYLHTPPLFENCRHPHSFHPGAAKKAACLYPHPLLLRLPRHSGSFPGSLAAGLSPRPVSTSSDRSPVVDSSFPPNIDVCYGCIQEASPGPSSLHCHT